MALHSTLALLSRRAIVRLSSAGSIDHCYFSHTQLAQTTMLKHSTLLILPLVLFVSGCSDEKMGYVTGKVTLNGEPFYGAYIHFTPQNSGTSPSSSGFKQDGTYEMSFSMTKKGVQVGPATVNFGVPSGGDYEPPAFVKEHKKFIESYTQEVVIKPGKQTFNFDLKTE